LRKKLIKNIGVYAVIFMFFLLPASSLAFKVDINRTKADTSNCQEHEYYSYQDMTDLLQEYKNDYPDIFKLESLGKTYEGRDIWLVKLSDNVETNEEEAGVLIMGAHHGNEKPSFEALIFFINHMVENYGKENTDDDDDGAINEDPIDGSDNDGDGQIDEDPSEDRVKNVIDNTDTRKNRAVKEGQTNNIGVDLNRNYGFKWGLYDIFPIQYNDIWTSRPESWNYRGEEPFSEAESTAVKNFVESEDIKVSLSYHSYGEFIIYPWTHTSQITPHEDIFISVGEGISSINQYDFYRGAGTIFPWPGGTIGTSENWLYGEQNILSYTIELCRTRAPTNPAVVYEYCLTHTGVNLYVCEEAQSIDMDKKVVSRLPLLSHLKGFSLLYKIIF